MRETLMDSEDPSAAAGGGGGDHSSANDGVAINAQVPSPRAADMAAQAAQRSPAYYMYNLVGIVIHSGNI